ncbi:autotransporter outer membrane beta-barrel domain-containing protein [Pseudomonas sp. LS1212]|uniref:autotransporter outer membrane beta-barrel domain-containing protein n=1 Tax=Pseudomonas sp. LS1212 TaxID=2972478 RepID=UPI00215D593E|nr:autotransporter outer membrane beta-barrel domain-containing protein [Pseudomonas sp. LS1212]UVJ43112.1 autotransporter outer membrane beta-barrel domain-containing protein [Pseudomonas sp. LS1212]
MPLSLLSKYADAAPEVVDGVVRNIDATTPTNSYQVINGGTLNAQGASTQDIEVTTGSTLNLAGGAVSASALAGIRLSNSQANLSGTRVTNTAGGGLFAARVISTTTGSTAVVSNSTISGSTVGASASAYSQIRLTDSHIFGTGAGSNGVNILGGRVTASGGSITGAQQGILMRRDTSASDQGAVLSLDNTTVVGQNGAAILVNDGVTAEIAVLNGTTLTGNNGNVLEVAGAATATFRVNNAALTGNIQVADASTANLTLDQATLTGDVIAAPGSTANVVLSNQSILTGRMDNVTSLAINSEATWVLTGDNELNSLALNGGRVSFGDPQAFYTLNVGSLSGNGTFVMASNFATGESDRLNVTGTATGNHGLLISSSGTEPAAVERMRVVQTGGGDAQFSLVNGPVDLGAWSYDLARDGNAWYLNGETRTVSPGTRSVLALFNTAPTVWYGELSSLRSRMGELRYSGGKRAGGWIRTYGNKYNVADASGVGYQQTQQGISLGADAPLPVGDGQWLVGLLAGHSKSDLDLNRGTSGTVESYYAGAYTTWLDADTGYYFDGVLKFNRFQNNAKVALSDGERAKGDYDNHGVGGSVEVGRHIKLDDGYFLEPFSQLSAVVIQSRDYALSNGLNAEGDRTRSLLGKVGATVGRTFDLGQGRNVQPYVKAAYAHEFAKNNEVQVNNNVFNNDLSGSRAELGVGVAASLSESFQVHADFDYSNGENIEQPYGVNIGVRYFW